MISRGILVLLACAATLAHAQLYRWVDEKGRVHYTETPPPASAKDVKKKREHMGATADPGLPFELQRAVRSAPVVLYSHPDCKGPCQMARDVLNKRGAPLKDLSAQDLTRPGTVFQIGVAPLRIDVLTAIDAVEFDEAWQARVVARFADLEVPVLAVAHLIRNKRAVGRAQDIADLEWLERNTK